MATIRQDASHTDGRLDEAVVSYLEALEAGQSPDPQAWLARYPDLSAELKDFFASQEQVNRWTEPLREVVAAATDVDDPLATISDTSATGAPTPAALADYEILGEIARGGMGIVYKARQISLNRIVALKMILAGPHVSTSDVHRFRLETEAAASLDHPSILPLYDVDEYRGRPYFSMKLIEGGSLAEQLPRFAADQRATARLLAAVARGVHHAHQRGILHRDLKPANILIDAGGQPYVTDFGLARRVTGDSSLTQSGAIVGTPSYMAPEQAAGRKDLTTAADIYSLGAILYTMLTNRPPFRADTPLETVREVLEVEPSRPRLLKRDVDRDLETICLKCLEKQPQQRYGSAEALAEDLERWLAGEPIQARRSSLWERALKKARRHPAGAALIIVSSLALMGLIASGLVYQDQRARIAERELREHLRVRDSRQRVQDLVSKAEVSLAIKNWQDASAQLSEALGTASDAPALKELHKYAAERLELCKSELAKNRARAVATAKHDAFLRYRDDVLFHGMVLVGVDLPTSLAATRDSGANALQIVGLSIEGNGTLALDPNFSAVQKKAVTEGCYVLLLVLAEAAAEQDPPDYGQALRLLERAGRIDLITQTYYLRLARYKDALGDVARAEQARQAAAMTQPNGALDHFLLGLDAAGRGERNESIGQFGQALDEEPNHFWARFYLASVLLPTSPNLAKEHLRMCLGQRKDSATLFLLRGIANRALEEFKAAEGDFKQALELAAGTSARDEDFRYAVLISRGILFHRQRRFSDAAADFRNAIDLKPDSYHAFARLAETRWKQEKFDAAISEFDDAIQRAKPRLAEGSLKPREVAVLYLNRAQLHKDQSDFDGAQRDIEEALAIEPFAEALAFRAYLAHLDRAFDKALLDYDQALRSPPADPASFDPSEVLRGRAVALLELMRYDEARKSLDDYFARGGKPDAEVYRLRGLTRAENRDLEGALSDYQRALDLAPNDSLTLAYRGHVYVVLNAYDLAKNDYQRAIRLDQENGEAYSGLAYVEVARRQADQAIANAEKALRPGPEPPTARRMFNVARIHGLAVTVKEDERRKRGELELAEQIRYRDRAVELLRQGMELLPEPQRASFWRETVQPDYARPEGAYWVFRNSPGFRQLAAKYEQPATEGVSP